MLVLTDVEGSTRLWRDDPDAMDAAMRRHHEIVHRAVAENDGWRPVDQGEGDAVFAAFASPSGALTAVERLQRELAAEQWPTSVPLRVRVAIHVGEVVRRDGNIFGEAVSRCARLRSLASGGQTLLSASVFELVRDKLPPGISVVDLGEHRMKDLFRPERVYQLDIDGLPRRFPPLASLGGAAHNLPVQAAPFIGREAELIALLAAVRAHRLVTVTGFGGMGKTRLALQAAAELVSDADAGDVWFVDLATETNPDVVPARIAEAAGVRVGTDDPARVLIAALAGRPTLLVLDNLEQILGCAGFVAELLSAAPDVRVLATSREPLHVRSERQFPLAAMGLPDAAGAPAVSAAALSTYEAVRFFVDRACAVRPDFTVTNETAPAVAAICARLDGHPLALELAASRVKMFAPEKLLARLDSALGVLTGGARDMPERHQTLRATIAWSFDALSPEEQLLLARMSVLPAAADLDLVEKVCGDGLDVLQMLDSLVERSLVRTVDSDGETRFGLLVSVRDFAAERLDAAAEQSLRGRHADHVGAMFAAKGRLVQSVGLVRRELPHLRAALSHLRQTDSAAAEVALLVAADDGLLHDGLIAEYLRLSQRALGLTDSSWHLAQLHLVRSMCFDVLGQQAQSRATASLALEEARRCDDPAVHANVAVIALGQAHTRAEVDDLVHEYVGLRPLLQAREAESFDREQANILAGALRFAEPRLAEDAARRFALTSDSGVGPLRLARVLLDTGRSDEAWEVLAPVQDASAFQGMRAWEVRGLVELARANLLRGEPATARELAQQAWDRSLSLGAAPYEAALVLADLERRSGRADHGAAVLERTLTDATEISGPRVGQLLWRRALCRHDAGRADEAATDIVTARQVLQDEELYVLELLGCLAAEAIIVESEDPARAARLLGCVEANLGGWALPFGLPDDVAPVTARLRSTHGEALEQGRVRLPSGAG
ncbi:MAG TPA: hypothetical protein VNA12_09120 [Mycobacteriales bacterium]|nr:hypothetical protein [Mycobacteriales bacterium]